MECAEVKRLTIRQIPANLSRALRSEARRTGQSLSQTVKNLLARGQSLFLQNTGDPPLSHQMSLQLLAHVRTRQALSLAYFDVFTLSAAVGVLLIAMVLLMRRSVAEKGAHIGAE